MSAIAVGNGNYVQQQFDWDGPVVAVDAKGAVDGESLGVTAVARRSVASEVRPMGRRGRCEHVGSVMGSVLSKYGLSLDDLLREIESRQ